MHLDVCYLEIKWENVHLFLGGIDRISFIMKNVFLAYVLWGGEMFTIR